MNIRLQRSDWAEFIKRANIDEAEATSRLVDLFEDELCINNVEIIWE